MALRGRPPADGSPNGATPGRHPAASESVTAVPDGKAPPAHGDRYKWIALSNTTLGVLMAVLNSSIVLIALPDIFRGIGLDPLVPANTGYLLWMLMGFMVVMAVLVVSLGRLGDMFGRVRMYHPRLRRLHAVLDPAVDHLDARVRRRAVHDHHAGRPGLRGRAAHGQLVGHLDRRLPTQSARPRHGHQQRGHDRR